MKWKWMTIGLLISAMGCGSEGLVGSGTPEPDFTELSYDVTAEATLNQVVEDLTSLTGVNFSIAPELQARLDEEPVDLPTLSGMKVGEVLVFIQGTMPPSTDFLYVKLAEGNILLTPSFEPREDFGEDDAPAIVNFNSGFLLTEPSIEDEECGGDGIVLGDGPESLPPSEETNLEDF